MTLTLAPRAILIISGLVALAIGGAVLVMPAGFYAGYGIILADGPNLLSELQGMGGLLLGSGGLIVAGALLPRLSLIAAVTSSVLYLGFAGGRILSMALNGLPSTATMLATAVELALGLAALFVVRRQQAEVAAQR
jgi:hypothetical protein